MPAVDAGFVRESTAVNIRYPEDSDLRRMLRFSGEDSLIWLGEHRVDGGARKVLVTLQGE